jgi:sulfite exporter TauE/SafE
MFLLAALSLGFLGSFHCVGMCGPIALAIPARRTSRFSAFRDSLIYNAGRIIAYAFMGFLFGLLGQGFALAGWQSWLSIVLGTLLLLAVLLPARTFRIHPRLFRLLEKLKAQVRKQFGIQTTRSLLLIGILNGFLPCGLVYLGIAGAVATGDIAQGALFMAVFGLGTFPAMLTVSALKNYMGTRSRQFIRKTVPVFVGLMALLLILRGMNLGIAYLSPSIETSGGTCHHQCCPK